MKELVLTFEQQLSFYLVQEGLKKSTWTWIHLKTSRNGQISDNETQKAQEFYDALREYRVLASYFEERLFKNLLKVNFFGAKNKQDLGAIEDAVREHEDIEIGIALGYPEDAIECFQTTIDETARNGRYADRQLRKAKKTKLVIPRWIAYLDHVPKYLDLLSGNVSESSKRRSLEFMEYTREHNPDLARRIEDYFLRQVDKL